MAGIPQVVRGLHTWSSLAYQGNTYEGRKVERVIDLAR